MSTQSAGGATGITFFTNDTPFESVNPSIQAQGDSAAAAAEESILDDGTHAQKKKRKMFTIERLLSCRS